MAGVPVELLSARDHGLPPDLRLAATLYLPPAPGFSSALMRPRVPGLVVGHGAGSRASRHEEFCLRACEHGFAVIAPDLRGHGDSDGSGDGPMEQDILAAVRFMRSHPAVDPDAICYRGSSMGGFYGLKSAPLAGFAALVLICPASEEVMLSAIRDEETDEGSTRRHTKTTVDTEAPGESSPAVTRWDRQRLRAYFERQDSRQLAALVQCPVLLVHVRSDRQVPFGHSLELVRHLRTDVTLLALQHGSHSSAQHDERVHSESLSWLRARLDARRTTPREA